MNIVLFGIALVQAALLASASEPVLTGKECLQQINEVRSEHANLHQVSNMNQLVYDEQLEDDLNSRDFKCSDYAHAKSEKIELVWNANRQVEIYRDMILNPGITKLACAQKVCEDGERITNVMVDVSSEEPVTGIPGSNCTEGRKPNRKGLCSPRSMVASRKFIDFSISDIIPPIPPLPVDKVLRVMPGVKTIFSSG